MAHVVTAPLVQVRLDTGGYAHVYEGGLLPDNADADHVAALVADGMVAEGNTAVESADVEPDSNPDEPPAKNASKDEWVAFAVAHGLDVNEAAGMSRDELRDLYA